jgi:hypothetical protein
MYLKSHSKAPDGPDSELSMQAIPDGEFVPEAHGGESMDPEGDQRGLAPGRKQLRLLSNTAEGPSPVLATAESDAAEPIIGDDARNVREARDSIQAFSFFSSAIAGQMGELYDKLAHVEIATSSDEFYGRLAQVEVERDRAGHELELARKQLQQALQENAALKDDLERQHVTFADHHAAKQEIGRLRGELDELREQSKGPSEKQEQRRRLFGRAG